jgi:hypothetical protein
VALPAKARPGLIEVSRRRKSVRWRELYDFISIVEEEMNGEVKDSRIFLMI